MDGKEKTYHGWIRRGVNGELHPHATAAEVRAKWSEFRGIWDRMPDGQREQELQQVHVSKRAKIGEDGEGRLLCYCRESVVLIRSVHWNSSIDIRRDYGKGNPPQGLREG